MDPNDNSESLILSHEGYMTALVRKIAKKLPPHVDFEELLGYGRLGLVEAGNRYSEAFGVSFETFAYYRIRGAVFDGLRKMTGLPSPGRREAQFEQAADEIAESIPEPSLDSNDAEAMADQLKKAIRSLGVVFILSDLGDKPDVPEPIDDETPDRQVEQRELIAKIKGLIERLPADQAQIVRLHYGQGLSLTNCAAQMGLHKAWVSRLHARAIEGLRKLLGEGPLPARARR